MNKNRKTGSWLDPAPCLFNRIRRFLQSLRLRRYGFLRDLCGHGLFRRRGCRGLLLCSDGLLLLRLLACHECLHELLEAYRLCAAFE